jgi:eukaryotic-like serine/threonine-protein kinase
VIDERWERVKDLLHQAMQLTEDQRHRLLDEQCQADEPLRREVESLLAADAEARLGFLQSGALDAGDFAGTLTVGQLFEQRFQLIRKLGEGGMGQVWLADQLAPVRRQVALKLLRAGLFDESVVRRFRSERQSLAIMDHPCIAKVFDAGATAQGQPYFVMEYVPGLPITEYCDSMRLKIPERLALLIRACEGVQHAHQKAVIHRDLKPANILVIEVDGVPMPRIIDFGLAKPTTPRLPDQTLHTHFGQIVGTPGYMSPEQVDSAELDIDTRTDVYSLGVILYVLLTGLQPYEARRRQRQPLDEWLRKLREEDPPPLSAKLSADGDGGAAAARSTEPRQLLRLLRGELEFITQKALCRDREGRYGSPAELAADLRRHLRNEPVVARPANAAYNFRKFIRRHRIVASVAGIVCASAILTSIAGVLAIQKQHEAEYQTRQALQSQSHLLTEVAAARLKESDVAGAQRIILDVLTNPGFPQGRSPAAISVFQETRAADAQLAVLTGHGDRVFSALYSPDGERIVTASADRSARIWDARTGAQLLALNGHSDRVFYGAYSPDGARIVTASHDRTARVWDAHTGAQLLLLAGHGERVDFASFAPDGARILTASWDKTARLWDSHTGAQLMVLRGHSDVIYSAAFSPDGSRIVTASQDKTARIWDARTGSQLGVLAGHGDYVACAAFSPDGTRIVTASADKTARIWDARAAQQLAVLSGHGDVVYSAAYSPAGTRIVTASWDKSARIWDAQSGKQLAVLAGHASTVASAAYSPDGSHIVTASQDRTARVWQASDRAQLGLLSGHRDVVASAAYSPDGTRIVTASWDQSARIWNALTYQPQLLLSGHAGAIDSAVFSPDGGRVLTTSQDKTARVWDARTGAALAMLSGHIDRVYSGLYSPDGTRIVTASRDKTARIWDANSGAGLAVLSGHRDRVYSGAWSRDGTSIVTASRDRTAITWNASAGAPLVTLKGHGDQVLTAAYSPDGQRVVTASSDNTSRIWDAHSGAELAVLSGHGSGVTSAAYSPDGKLIITASEDRTARIWDAQSAEQLAVLAGHDAAVTSAAYSPDGKLIVTASEDHTARVWDAHIPGNLATQILWDASAQSDPLSETERAQLGLPRDPRVRTWSSAGSACDEAAGAFYDPDRVSAGVPIDAIGADSAISACSAEINRQPHVARADYQMGRALLAKQDASGAERQLESAVAAGYRAARVELADELAAAPESAQRSKSVVALYEKAWQDGVPIAAYRLGQAYEHGSAVASDASKAWLWYRQGGDAGEPNCLGRFAERQESAALAATDSVRRNALLLEAFAFYAVAAEYARLQDWPDDAWRRWRHRRASLARVLAQEGMMQQVADSYRAIITGAVMGTGDK